MASDIIDDFTSKRVKVVYRDGSEDDTQAPKIKTFMGVFNRRDGTMAQFTLDNGTKTAISLSDVVRITEKPLDSHKV